MLLTAAPWTSVLAAQNSEQVIFSGTGFGFFGGSGSPFGFWIWCEADSQNPYAGSCSGAMYIYELGIVKGVKGTAPAITEGPDGIYTINVASADGMIACQLSNATTAVHGPNNVVNAICSAPLGGGSTSSAVVNVTGP